MQEPTNNQRADWAMLGLLAFAEATGLRSKTNHEDLDAIVGDLLTDLMHLCDREDVNFSGMLERAREHYREEIEIESTD